MSLLRRIEKSLDQRLRGIFSGARDEPGAREAIELYRDALDQIGARATVGKRGDRIFPFDLITIELQAATAERKAVLETLFEAGQLVDDIRATLAEEKIAILGNLTVAVHYPAAPDVEMLIRCEKNEQPVAATSPVASTSAAFVPARLSTLTGIPNFPDFFVERPHANIGRESEVVDSLGRIIRRNDLCFAEGVHEANASISRSHAHVKFDGATGEWRIYDDGSTLGTSIFRDGKRIDVPAHSARGVLLRAGDEIYLGQVRLRFEA